MLLDMVLISEKIYRANSRRKSTEKSPDEQDDYSSDLDGEAWDNLDKELDSIAR